MNIFKKIVKTATLALLAMGNASLFAPAEDPFNHQQTWEDVLRIDRNREQLILRLQTQINAFLATKTPAEVQQLITSHIQQVQPQLGNIVTEKALLEAQDPFAHFNAAMNDLISQHDDEMWRLTAIIDYHQIHDSEITHAMNTQKMAINADLVSAEENMPHRDLIDKMMEPVRQQAQQAFDNYNNQIALNNQAVE